MPARAGAARSVREDAGGGVSMSGFDAVRAIADFGLRIRNSLRSSGEDQGAKSYGNERLPPITPDPQHDQQNASHTPEHRRGDSQFAEFRRRFVWISGLHKQQP